MIEIYISGKDKLLETLNNCMRNTKMRLNNGKHSVEAIKAMSDISLKTEEMFL